MKVEGSLPDLHVRLFKLCFEVEKIDKGEEVLSRCIHMKKLEGVIWGSQFTYLSPPSYTSSNRRDTTNCLCCSVRKKAEKDQREMMVADTKRLYHYTLPSDNTICMLDTMWFSATAMTLTTIEATSKAALTSTEPVVTSLTEVHRCTLTSESS